MHMLVIARLESARFTHSTPWLWLLALDCCPAVLAFRTGRRDISAPCSCPRGHGCATHGCATLRGRHTGDIGSSQTTPPKISLLLALVSGPWSIRHTVNIAVSCWTPSNAGLKELKATGEGFIGLTSVACSRDLVPFFSVVRCTSYFSISP